MCRDSHTHLARTSCEAQAGQGAGRGCYGRRSHHQSRYIRLRGVAFLIRRSGNEHDAGHEADHGRASRTRAR